MTKELEDQLYKDFPELFAEKDLPMTETCMCWGIECGDGWEPIIRNTCKSLKSGSALARQRKLYPYQDEISVWFHNLCRRIERKLKLKYNTLYSVKHREYRRFPGFYFRFSQIKEKFGTLRLYFNFGDNFNPEDVAHLDPDDVHQARERERGKIDGVLTFADILSTQTCEKCGSPGKLIAEGWWKTECRTCAESRGKKYDTDK